ncbi:MAG: response regulator [Phycisphaerales bacterium]|jgi:response regulator NasT|nr:response regulator [Phycisphaerales bacterium]
MTQTQSRDDVVEPDYPEEPRRILVADDEHLVAQGVVAALQSLGLEVIGPCRDGEEAINQCRADRPDLALVDIQMPGINGVEAARRIFAELEIPVVILSAFSGDEYLRDSGEAGVFGYLLKPANQDQLRAGLAVAWQRFLDYMDQRSQIIDLKKRLEDRKVIEQAKWIVVSRKEVTEPEAMKLLQKQSRSTRQSLVEVAKAVIDSDKLL